MTEGANGDNGAQIKATLSPELAFGTSPPDNPDLSIRIPKNKSTGNLLTVRSAGPERTRFSFDAGSTQQVKNLKRPSRPDNDFGLGMSGLRRIRRPPVPSRTPSLVIEDGDWLAPTLQHASTLPVSTSSSRSVSRSASFGYIVSGPASPALEDLQRFPAESLHSFSFSKQSEDYLHSRQNIIQKSVDFVRDRSQWAANPALADARARASGDTEIQGMMDLLKKANILPTDRKESNQRGVGLGLGPMTGPADVDGRNIFDNSFSQSLDSVEEGVAVASPPTISPTLTQRGQDVPDERPPLARTASNEEISPTAPRRIGLKRTYTDLNAMSLQQKLIDALAQPYSSEEHVSGHPKPAFASTAAVAPSTAASAVHTHSHKYTPAAQAVFRTGGEAPWTILAANDLACLVFGVTRAEVRSLSILGIIQEDRRSWLEEKLGKPVPDQDIKAPPSTQTVAAKSLLGAKGGITARLLSKAPARTTKPVKRSQTDDGSGGYYRSNKNHPPTKSRGVLLCGDIVPIQKRDGTIGSASFWVMEKKGGLIWVVEEIREDTAVLTLDGNSRITSCSGDPESIWGYSVPNGTPLKMLLPCIPDEMSFFDRRTPSGQPAIGHFTARTAIGVNVPATISKVLGKSDFRVSSLPHIAGMMVLSPETLNIKSSNSVFSASLFGYEHPGGLSVATLIPSFKDILNILTEEEGVEFVDGLVVPEHSFRRAYALRALREGNDNAASVFMRPSGLPAKHRDGSDIMVDVQMRVVRSETVFPVSENAIHEQPEAEEKETADAVAVTELVYAVWITYSRQLHAAGNSSADDSRPMTPPTQPAPPAHLPSPPPANTSSDESMPSKSADSSQLSLLSPTTTVEDAEPLDHPPPHVPYVVHDKKTIQDFIILEEMGSGAYGQVKLGRYRKARARKVVLKYVTKKRILVDTWTRDRRLGTVPLEIHVMDYLRRDGLRHPNIVEMIDFFEDDVNYYIEMLPHGIPGMDLFDYIELRNNMEEEECRSIFRQVADAIHHLHVKAGVVHRDIKDENVVLDGEGRIKLIDFGSAAYTKSGPFDVFVGTIDYAAPEVLQGKAYGGKEQDVWALGILLYTIVYKENPFYNIDEILDHPLRIPYNPFSDECLDLIQRMLDRDVDQRVDIQGVVAHPWLTGA